MDNGGMEMTIFQNTCKPEGVCGKIMLNMMNRGHATMAAWGFKHISVDEDAVSLDVGCGGGMNIKKLLEKSPDGCVKGIDYSEASVAMSEKVNRKAIDEGRCEIIQGNVMELPYDEESFDLVTAFETIYFWPDIVQAFRQIYRVLKEDGKFMICNESNGENPKDAKWIEKIEGMRIYNEPKIREALIEAGFRKIKIDSNHKNWLCVVVKK